MPRQAESSSFWGGFLRALSTVLLVGLVLLAGAVAVVPAVTKGRALTVLSGSMEPAFSPGDLIVVSGIDSALDLKVGDIITYMPNPGEPDLVTHRVIGVGANADGERLFTTQGDANDAPDDPVSAQQVRGKYLFHIPYVGYVSDWGSKHAPWAIGAFAVVLMAWGAWALFAPRRRKKTEEAGEQDASEPTPTEPALSERSASEALVASSRAADSDRSRLETLRATPFPAPPAQAAPLFPGVQSAQPAASTPTPVWLAVPPAAAPARAESLFPTTPAKPAPLFPPAPVSGWPAPASAAAADSAAGEPPVADPAGAPLTRAARRAAGLTTSSTGAIIAAPPIADGPSANENSPVDYWSGWSSRWTAGVAEDTPDQAPRPVGGGGPGGGR